MFLIQNFMAILIKPYLNVFEYVACSYGENFKTSIPYKKTKKTATSLNSEVGFLKKLF